MEGTTGHISLDLTYIIYMKVGAHTSEDLKAIINRKKSEEKDAGFAFWGYGGSVCHPSKQVQPFAQEAIRNGHVPILVMVETRSQFNSLTTIATQFSENKVVWLPIPEGIRVTGSEYAIKCRNLMEASQLNIDISTYKVGIGPSQGVLLSEYIGNRVDKACARLDVVDQPRQAKTSKSETVCYVAELVEPFAVFVQ